MTAARTANGVRALDAGQAQVILALGALLVNVRLSILPAVLSELEPLPNTGKES